MKIHLTIILMIRHRLIKDTENSEWYKLSIMTEGSQKKAIDYVKRINNVRTFKDIKTLVINTYTKERTEYSDLYEACEDNFVSYKIVRKLLKGDTVKVKYQGLIFVNLNK